MATATKKHSTKSATQSATAGYAADAQAEYVALVRAAADGEQPTAATLANVLVLVGRPIAEFERDAKLLSERRQMVERLAEADALDAECRSLNGELSEAASIIVEIETRFNAEISAARARYVAVNSQCEALRQRRSSMMLETREKLVNSASPKINERINHLRQRLRDLQMQLGNAQAFRARVESNEAMCRAPLDQPSGQRDTPSPRSASTVGLDEVARLQGEIAKINAEIGRLEQVRYDADAGLLFVDGHV